MALRGRPLRRGRIDRTLVVRRARALLWGDGVWADTVVYLATCLVQRVAERCEGGVLWRRGAADAAAAVVNLEVVDGPVRESVRVELVVPTATGALVAASAQFVRSVWPGAGEARTGTHRAAAADAQVCIHAELEAHGVDPIGEVLDARGKLMRVDHEPI